MAKRSIILKKKVSRLHHSLVSPRNDLWWTSAEIPYWWQLITRLHSYTDLGSTSDETKQIFNQSQIVPISGWWQVISMEFLQSFLKRYITRSNGVVKCRLLCRARLNQKLGVVVALFVFVLIMLTKWIFIQIFHFNYFCRWCNLLQHPG